jgi:hypothetical protein
MRAIGLALLPIALAFAAPAAASDLIEGSCDAVTDGDTNGCLYAGNINGQPLPNQNGYEFAEQEYNTWATNTGNPLIDLVWITKTDDANFGDFGTFTGQGQTTGTFELPGWDVDYFAVKFGNEFILFEYLDSLENPDGSYNWGTFDQNGMSHIAFFGTRGDPLPEPGTWAMMLMGFGAAGYQLRKSRRQRGEVLQAA